MKLQKARIKGSENKRRKAMRKEYDPKLGRVVYYYTARPAKRKVSKEEKASEKAELHPGTIEAADYNAHLGMSAHDFIVNNYGLAVSIANTFADKWGIPKFVNNKIYRSFKLRNGTVVNTLAPEGKYADVMQTALIGMFKGINRYVQRAKSSETELKQKPSDYAFSYAKEELKQNIVRIAKDMGHMVPIKHIHDMNAMTDVRAEMLTELGRMPTIQELAARMGKTEESIRKKMEAMNLFYTASLEAAINDDKHAGGKEVALIDTLPGAHETEKEYFEKEDKKAQVVAIRRALRSLEPYEREIVMKHFGIGIEKVTRHPRTETVMQTVFGKLVKRIPAGKTAGKRVMLKLEDDTHQVFPAAAVVGSTVKNGKKYLMIKHEVSVQRGKPTVIEKQREAKDFLQIAQEVKVPMTSKSTGKTVLRHVSDTKLKDIYYGILQKLHDEHGENLAEFWKSLLSLGKLDLLKSTRILLLKEIHGV